VVLNLSVDFDSFYDRSLDFINVTMKMWGVDDKELDRIRQTIVNGSERLLDRIIEYECSLSSDVRGGAGAETDLIGRWPVPSQESEWS
jgi:hypothetical protein